MNFADNQKKNKVSIIKEFFMAVRQQKIFIMMKMIKTNERKFM